MFFYLISRLYSPSNSVRMLTPPEAFDERKLPRTTVSLLRTTGTSIGSVQCCNRGRLSCRGPRSLPTQESCICQGEGCATAGATFYLDYKSQINKPVFRQQTLGYVSLSCLASHSRGYCRSLSQCRSLSPCSC